MSDESLRVPVLIAGGGPVGLVVALELGTRGVGCMVLNDQPTTAQHPKANAISARSMEHFRRLGLAGSLRAAGLDDDHPTDVAYFTGLTGLELGRLHMPSRAEALRQARDGEGPWPSPEPPHRCSQIFLEQALQRRSAGLSEIDLRFGWRLVSFTEEAGGVRAAAVEVATGRTIEVEADYLVGCDGGGSMVRKTLGIEFEGESGVVRPFMGGSMFAVYFKAKVDPFWLSVKRSWQYWVINPDIRALLIHVDSDDLFVIHTAIAEGTDPASIDAQRLIQKVAGTEFPVDVISSVPWTAGYSLVAERYAAGRVFLAGDAVHLFTPTGGMGMNTGVDDAVNLGWKLAAVCRGWADPALLDSYEAERRSIGIRNVGFARGFATSVGTVPVSRDIEDDTPDARAERAALRQRLEDHAYSEFIIPGIQFGLRYDGSPIVAGDAEAVPPDLPNSYTPSARAGSRAPHAWLPDRRALFDLLGPGYSLLRLGGSRADATDLMDAAKRRQVPLDVVDVAGDETRDLYGRDLVLIRPDQHVAWRGNAPPDDSAALIDLVRGAGPTSR